ncbi:MAG: VanZ family protein [Lachnospiraceae bacterium]|nr:VanZ family protein [Lachnospiraceae bacterium]
MENLILVGYEMILAGYEGLTVFVPAAITIWVLRLRYKKGNDRETGGHILWMLVFAVYIFGVFHFTGAGTIFHIKQYGLEYNVETINLMPFSDANMDKVGYGLNVVLFVPLGFLLPLIWSNLNKIKYACTAGILLSLLVELSQLLNIRSTDIDDLILNSAGAMLGFLMFRLYSRITKRDVMPMAYCKYEAAIYISVMFLCRFFFYNELGIAKLLYGF